MIIIIIQNIYIKVTNKKYLLSFFGCNFKDLTKIVIFKIKNFYIWMSKTTINDSITLLRLNYFNKYRFYLVSFINVNIKKKFIKHVTINVKKCAPAEFSLGVNSMDYCFRLISVAREACSNFVNYFICAFE